MNVLLGFLTVIMVLDCVILVFLVLLQLPKKEAGAGMAFGGAANDALFGAGSGNALTTITKYAAGIFFGLALIMAMITSHQAKSGGNALQDALTKAGSAGHIVAPPPAAGAPATAPAESNFMALPGLSNSAPATAPNSTVATPLPATKTPAPSTNK